MFSIRGSRFLQSLVLVCAGLTGVLAAQTAAARNVPGSAAAAAYGAAEVATGMVIDGIQDDVRSLRGDDRTGVSLSASGMNDAGAVTVMARGQDGFVASANLRFRNIDTADLNYDLTTGALLLGFRTDARTLVFGGLLLESGHGRTPFNTGTLRHDGRGIALGIDHAVNDRLSLQAIAGQMWLGYDFTRSGGAVSGKFDATRSFVDLSGEYRLDGARSTTLLRAGLRYMTQSNDAHVEAGGGAVAKTSGDTLSATLGLRSTLHTQGWAKPFVSLNLRSDLSRAENFPAGLSSLLNADNHARLGIGVSANSARTSFETGVGSNFDNIDGYAGLDAYLSLIARF